MYEFYETASPHVREPLTERVAQLAAAQFPGLATLRSCDLHPSSWIAVAWCAFCVSLINVFCSMLWRCLARNQVYPCPASECLLFQTGAPLADRSAVIL